MTLFEHDTILGDWQTVITKVELRLNKNTLLAVQRSNSELEMVRHDGAIKSQFFKPIYTKCPEARYVLFSFN